MNKTMFIFIIILIVAGVVSTIFSLRVEQKDYIEKVGVEEKIVENLTGDYWPVNTLTKAIPKPTNGKLSIVSLGKTVFNYKLEDVNEDDYQRYVKLVKDGGFKNNVNEGKVFTASNDDGLFIRISMPNKKQIDVSATKK